MKAEKLAKAHKKYEEEFHNSPFQRLKRANKRIAELESELALYRSGHKGACYACESVGELNQQLQAQLAEARALLSRVPPPDASDEEYDGWEARSDAWMAANKGEGE